MSIGANIKTKRCALNMSQKDLAQAVNVKQAMICQIERGTKVPSLPLSLAIAQALHCEITELAEGMI